MPSNTTFKSHDYMLITYNNIYLCLHLVKTTGLEIKNVISRSLLIRPPHCQHPGHFSPTLQTNFVNTILKFCRCSFVTTVQLMNTVHLHLLDSHRRPWWRNQCVYFSLWVFKMPQSIENPPDSEICSLMRFLKKCMRKHALKYKRWEGSWHSPVGHYI